FSGPAVLPSIPGSEPHGNPGLLAWLDRPTVVQEPNRAVVEDVVPQPASENREAIPVAGDVIKMKKEPRDPADQPAERDLSHLRHGRMPPDRRHGTLVEIP